MIQPQQPPQLNRIQQMDNMMQNVRRDDGLSNLRALSQMRQMKENEIKQMLSPQPVSFMAKGGFPDLSGDGQITQKDILMGRGVIERRYGGLAGLPEVQAFGGFNPFKPIKRAGRKIAKAGQRLAGAAKDVVDSGLSGISSALGGGKGTGDFLKTLALMAVTNMLIPGGGPLMTAAKAYVVPSLATEGIKGVTSDPFREDKLIRAGAAGLTDYFANKYAASQTPKSTDILSNEAIESARLDSIGDTTSGLEGTIDIPDAKPSFGSKYIKPAVDATKQFVSDVASYELPTIGAPYDVAQLGKDAVLSYGATETKKAMDEIKEAEQAARGVAEQIQKEAEAKQMTAQQFAKAAMEDPVKYSYVYKYGANPQSVRDILERMYGGAEDIQTAQYFEPATYTTESGRLPGELTAAGAYGGGISTIINNAIGQNKQFADGMVPNTVDRKSDGMSDSETMLITDRTGRDPKGIMKISEEEYVISAPDMAILGNGSAQAGAQKLDNFRKDLRKMAYGTSTHQPRIDSNKALQSLIKG